MRVAGQWKKVALQDDAKRRSVREVSYPAAGR